MNFSVFGGAWMSFLMMSDGTRVRSVKCYMSWQSCCKANVDASFTGDAFSQWTLKLLVNYKGSTEVISLGREIIIDDEVRCIEFGIM